MLRRAPASLVLVTAPVLMGVVVATPAASTTPPKVVAVAPRTGPAAGGTRVTITGSGFSGLTRSRVTFGTTAATSITVVSSTKVTATAPRGSAGRVNVHIVTTHGTSASNAADGFTYIARPTITSVTRSSGGTRVAWGPDTGGSDLTVTGTNFRTGMSVKFANKTMTGVTELDANHLEFTSPKNAPGAVDISVTSPGGTATKTGAFSYRRWWQTPATIDASEGAPAVLSCPDQKCYAIDSFNNLLTRSGPTQPWTNAGNPISPGNTIDDLSCATDTFCAAVDDAGRASTYNGTSWKQSASKTMYLGGPLKEVSCTSTTFCLALDSFSDYTLWNGTSWSNLRALDGTLITRTTPYPTNPVDPTLLSCEGATDGTSASCATVDGNNHARTFVHDPGDAPDAWSAVQFTDHGFPSALSCFDNNGFQCVLTDSDSNGNARAFHLKANSWGTASPVATGFQISSVSCSQSSAVCRAVDNGGNVYTLSTTGPWSSATPTGAGTNIYAISCGPSYCFTSNRNSTTSTYTIGTSTWSAPTKIVDEHLGITSLACGDPSDCLASDGGFVTVESAGTWAPPVDLGLAGDSLVSTACASGDFCMAATFGGKYVTDTAGALSAVQSSGLVFLVALTCDTAGSCYAASSDAAYHWDSTNGWDTTPITVPISSGDSIVAISCPDTAHCMIVTEDGDAFVMTGGATPVAVAPTGAAANEDVLRALSCSSSTFCVAVGSGGYAYRWNGNSWTSSSNLTGGGQLNAVSCSTSKFCLAVGGSGDGYNWTGSTWQASRTDDAAPLYSVAASSDSIALAGDRFGRIVAFQ